MSHHLVAEPMRSHGPGRSVKTENLKKEALLQIVWMNFQAGEGHSGRRGSGGPDTKMSQQTQSGRSG